MAKEEFEKLVASLYENYKKGRINRLSDSTLYEWSDVERLYSLICMLKKSENKKNLYLLVKDFISIYVTCVERRDYGYDFLNFDKIFNAISTLKCRESLELLRFFKRKLVDKGFSEEVVVLINKIKKKQYECAFSEYLNSWHNLRRLGRLIVAWITKDIYGLFFGLLSLLVLSIFFLLPNNVCQECAVFAFDKNAYSSNWLINHALNVIVLFFSLSDKVDVSPLSFWGIFLLVLERVLFWVIVVKYLIKEIEERYL
ncbi:hypothetical protein Cpar_0122 [Chlorobaculum parvum NCIB 8327]|uniref:Uncharacterized protein n=1 Tax=Chlorobaculum parvum (strain DSM 263 / NCIMB 8327) TaxID=517417 RepID=B3QRM8_CHLP8|nr:hypothetical protein [Chlorobaculum parvum]ACF10550.1 hypothetical protein Cpar_0122 [Chlorobaculum parvum NCIB 8327]